MGGRLFLVLGMHRSGTSVLTRALRIMGARLGDEHLHAHPCNPKGFFEDADLNSFNKRLLKEMNSAWRDPRPIDIVALKRLSAGAVGLQALALLKEKTGKDSALALKDPRMCRLLPFWRPVLAAAGLDVHCLVALRHPKSVAASLRQRDQLVEERSHALWIAHTLDALVHSEGLPRLCVDYDILMQTPKHQITRLGQFLNARPDKAELNLFLADFLDNGLRHHTVTPHADNAGGDCAVFAGRLYENLRLAAIDKLDLESPRFQRSLRLRQQEAIALCGNLP
ncbi:MAG: glycosyl transferase family 1 [Desulfovibrio sp.]|jgi:hypothetical protein|nr:glycosyl transferase family 1 [Desulfovibrio sp.]